MGTGHLNAKRALDQFAPGDYDAGGAAVPPVGWDSGTTLGRDDIQKYSLAQPIPAGQFVSLTLAWDREVFFDIDGGMPNHFDVGDEFVPSAVPDDLNLYLVPQGATDTSQAVAQSVAEETSVEHIFQEINDPGQYEIWVEQASGTPFSIQPYGLAYWLAPLAPSPTEMGDYSGNGTVGPEDYDVWKANFGTSFADADGNGNGIVDAADYTVWRDHLGQSLGSGSLVQAVPEPACIALVSVGLLVSCLRRHGQQVLG